MRNTRLQEYIPSSSVSLGVHHPCTSPRGRSGGMILILMCWGVDSGSGIDSGSAFHLHSVSAFDSDGRPSRERRGWPVPSP